MIFLQALFKAMQGLVHIIQLRQDFRTAAPELFAAAMTFTTQLLPAPAPGGDNQARSGRESESEWADPSAPLTASTYKAAEDNNEL